MGRRLGRVTGVVGVVLVLGVGLVSASVPGRAPRARAGGSRTGTYERGTPRAGCSLYVQEGPRDRLRFEIDCEARTAADRVATVAAGVLRTVDGVGTYRGPDAVGGTCAWAFRFGRTRVSVTPRGAPSGAPCRFPAGMAPHGVFRRTSARRPTLPGDAGYDPL